MKNKRVVHQRPEAQEKKGMGFRPCIEYSTPGGRGSPPYYIYRPSESDSHIVLGHYAHTFNGNWVAVRTYALVPTRIQSSGMGEGCSVTAPRPILAPLCSTWCLQQSAPADKSHIAPSYSTVETCSQNGVTVAVTGWMKWVARWCVRTPLGEKTPEEGCALTRARAREWCRYPVAMTSWACERQSIRHQNLWMTLQPLRRQAMHIALTA